MSVPVCWVCGCVSECLYRGVQACVVRCSAFLVCLGVAGRGLSRGTSQPRMKEKNHGGCFHKYRLVGNDSITRRP